MKILIINQHTRNHGDEAAGLALVRGLHKNGYSDITISYNGSMNNWNDSCYLKYQNVKQLSPSPAKINSERMIKMYLKYPSFVTKIGLFLFHNLRKEYKQIRKSDYIISAPGGPNLGKYQDSHYLWRLYIAYKLGKKYAIYSPSIGPFDKTRKKYKTQAKQILNNADFLSLRDKQSIIYAQELNVQYLEAIDTAFLEAHDDQIPIEVKLLLPDKYIVIVPHQLFKWHQDFIQYESIIFDQLFLSLINQFLENGHKIVLLPQTFQSRLDDEGYFRALKSNNANIIVIPTNFSSDIQQRIISKAEFVIGARYHSIVFSINNKTPFFCLSYEHKMIDMLRILGLECNSIDIHKALESPIESSKLIYSHYLNRNQLGSKISIAHVKAKQLAKECFSSLILRLKSCE